jgi:hypothetical protein
MSLIEQAATRLAQLRKAGVEVPGAVADAEQLPPSVPVVDSGAQAGCRRRR